MKNFLACIFIFCCITISKVQSQDLHFTQNHFAPVYFNPAQTGAFLGTYRINAIYRDQNRAGFQTAFQTPILSVDSPFMFGLKKTHWVGGGITLYKDQAGDHGYSSTGFLGSLAYHIGLDKKLKNVFTIGARYGFVSRSIREMDGVFGDEIVNSRGTQLNSPDRMKLMNFSGGFTTASVGVLFKSKTSKTSSLEIGASGIHVVSSTYTFNSSTAQNETSMRLNGHAKLNFQVGKQFVLAPTAYYSNESTSDNIVIQLNSAYRLKKVKKGEKNDSVILYPGIGMRLGDALQFLIGAKIKKYKIGIAYDYSINDYSSITKHGAFEIGLQRIFEIKKKPEIKPIIFCPRI